MMHTRGNVADVLHSHQAERLVGGSGGGGVGGMGGGSGLPGGWRIEVTPAGDETGEDTGRSSGRSSSAGRQSDRSLAGGGGSQGGQRARSPLSRSAPAS